MMNNCNELLQQAESLKQELSNGRNGLSSDGSGKGEWISSRTLLQDVYRQLLITNLEYALDKKIEQELWNFAFKNHITALQQQVKDKSNNFRSEAQSQLTSFLDAASGFYTQLLDDLCQTFHIDIPYRVHSSKLVFLKDSGNAGRSSIAQPERPSCQYMCQHSLVHLGDIARYRNQIGQAESYYRYAAQLVPSNGQPYNQLAILAAAGGDVLSTAFYYCRSLAVKCPFPGSDTNLRRQLTKIMAGDEPRHTKISTSELVKFCLKFHACIYLKRNENELMSMVEKLSGYIRAHLRAGSLSKQQITHITFLNLFSLYHLAPSGVNAEGEIQVVSSVTENTEENGVSGKGDKEIAETFDQGNLSWSALLTFTMHMLGGLLACVPAHSDDAADLEHPALPSIKLTLDWLAANVAVLLRPEVAQNSRVWPRLAKVLNALGNQDKANNMDNHHLPEDLEVRGFIGLKSSLSKLAFMGGIESGVPAKMEHACRCYRLYQLGMTISLANGDLLSFAEETNGTVFSSSISPSPQHGTKTNGMEEMSEEGSEEELELCTTPPKSSSLKGEESQLETQSSETSSWRGTARTKGVLKVLSDDHSSSLRKKNRAPRMQNVAVQIKPDQKLKVIKEEDGGRNDSYLPLAETESGGQSTESSQGDASPGGMSHSRSGHRVTFATAQQVSPTPYPQEDSPSPVGSNYMDQSNMMMPGGPVYPEANLHHAQQQHQSYLSSMHLVNQQMGPIYRHPPAGSPILAGPFARRGVGVGPYPFPHNMIPRPRVPMPPYQHVQGANPPPHPAELPKPVFRSTMYNPTAGSTNFRAPGGNQQISMTSQNPEPTIEQVMKMSRPSDMNYFQHLQQQNRVHAMGNMVGSTRDITRSQRPVASGLTMAAQFANRPDVSSSIMQQLRLNEMAKDSTSEPHLDMGANSNLPFSGQNLQKMNYPNQRLDYPQYVSTTQQQAMMMRSQVGNMTNPASGMQPRQMQSMESDLSRIPQDLTRSFPGNVFMPSSNAGAICASNSKESTSSPTPGSLNQLTNLPSSKASPQAGGISNISCSGNVLGPRLSSIMMENPQSREAENPMRPNTLPGAQAQLVGVVGSPSKKLTPTGLSQFLNVEHQQQGENAYMRDLQSHQASSLFGISQTSTAGIVDDRRALGHQASSQQTPTDAYAMQQDRVKAMFEESGNMNPLTQISKNPLESLQANQPPVAQIDKFQDSMTTKEDKDSYKLFPVTDSAWGISRASRGVGTIGSERAAAQNQRFSPWGGPSQPPSQPSVTLSDKLEMQRAPDVSPNNAESTYASLQSQSFWSTPMVPSGPSALEQLIRQQQQQHVTRDKSPP